MENLRVISIAFLILVTPRKMELPPGISISLSLSPTAKSWRGAFKPGYYSGPHLRKTLLFRSTVELY